MKQRMADEAVSVCALLVDGRRFALETHALREVVGRRGLRRVPLAPAFVAGVMPYRGDVLTTVSLRALLGLPEQEEGCVIVLDGLYEPAGSCPEGAQTGERFGLLVDAVGGVVTVEPAALAPNPATVGATGRSLFDGAYRLSEGLMVRLDPARLSPGHLREAEKSGNGGDGDACTDRG